MIEPLWTLSATETRNRINAGEVSSAEVVDSSLTRIEDQDPSLNAFLTICGERARAEAHASDMRRRGGEPPRPLEGVPFAVKDLTDTAGMRTTSGSLAFVDRIPAEDELCVARLRRAGAILVGKTNTPEFGFGPRSGNRLRPAAANPFDPTKSAGGSSGGSASAVASGMVPLAHGTDFGGSVRTPASFCGIVGLRPTPGLIPSPGKSLAWNALSTHGVLARGIDDAELMLSVMAGYDARDPLARPCRHAPHNHIESEIAGLRISVSADLGCAPVSKEVRGAFATAVQSVARQFRRIEEATPDCSGAIKAFTTLRAAIVRRQYGPMVADSAIELSEALIWNSRQGDGLTAEDILQAEQVRSRVYSSFITFFERHDALITPAAAVSPFAVEGGDILDIDGVSLGGPLDYLAITFVVSLLGFPCLSIPAGIFESGCPFGLQITAPPYREDLLIALARRLAEDSRFRHRWP
jgi:amidase